MAFKPVPQTYSCPSCNWNTIYAPSSDALTIPAPKQCPRCGTGGLLVQPATQVDLIADRLLSIVLRRS